MGEIVEKVKKLWDWRNEPMYHFAEAIDSEFAALRQEIQDLKTDIKDGSASTLDYKEPEPDLQRGDFVSYMWQPKNEKVWGIFHHYDGGGVCAYWREINGGFRKDLGYMPRDRVTFEFRPEK